MKLHQWLGRRLAISKNEILTKLVRREVLINGVVTQDSNQRVSEFDTIQLKDDILQHGKPKIYIAIHKPKGILSATADPIFQTVIDLIDHPQKDQLHLAGRLDRASTGLVLLSNDGKWTQNITEATSKVEKEYLVETALPLKDSDIHAFAQGFYFHTEDIVTLPSRLEILSERLARVTLVEGRYHQIKRMFHRVDNRVLSLHRHRIGAIELTPDLPPGEWRLLSEQEVESLSCGLSN